MVKFLFCASLSCIALISCSKSIYKGEHKSRLTTDESKKIVVLDYTDVEPDLEDDVFRFVSGSDLNFVHIYCINNQPEAISADCIMQCGSTMHSDLTVVCRTASLKEGASIIYHPDYQVRTEDHDVVRPDIGTKNVGSVFFDIYENRTGGKIASFDVTVRISGTVIKNKRGLGYSNVNLTTAQNALRKARRKGLKNIAGRVIH